MDTVDKDELDLIIDRHGKDPSYLISVLQDIQEEYNYLEDEMIEYISKNMDISLEYIDKIIEFYEFFRRKPMGRHIIKICDGKSCNKKNSLDIIDIVKEKLELEEGEKTSKDLEFTIETVSCLGACEIGPAISINDKLYGNMTPDSIVELMDNVREK